MRYSIEPRDICKRIWIFVFWEKQGKNLSNKYGQKLLDSARKSTTDAIKTASKRAIQKTAEATGDLIGNKIADKITSVSKKSSSKDSDHEIEAKKASPKDTPKKKIYISRRKTTNYWSIKVGITI